MDEFKKFALHVDLGFNDQPFDHEFVIYYASKYYSFYLKNLLKKNNIAKTEYNSIISRFLQINWSCLNININNTMFRIINGTNSQKRDFLTTIIRNPCTPFFATYFALTYPATYFIPTIDSASQNLDFLEATYPNLIDFKQLFYESIRVGRVDCYKYLKNKINVDEIEDNYLNIKNIDILFDIFNNQYNLYNKINVNYAIVMNNYDNNIIHIIYMMGLLFKFDDFTYIKRYCQYMYDTNISCEVMDYQIINTVNKFTNDNIIELFSIFFNS